MITQPSGADARNDLATLLAPLASGDYVQKIISGDPDGEVNGESPIILLLNNGTSRAPESRGTPQNNNLFQIELSILVADGSPNVQDLTEKIDQQIATLISENRVNPGSWDFASYDSEFSEKGRGLISGLTYWITSSNVILQVW